MLRIRSYKEQKKKKKRNLQYFLRNYFIWTISNFRIVYSLHSAKFLVNFCLNFFFFNIYDFFAEEFLRARKNIDF